MFLCPHSDVSVHTPIFLTALLQYTCFNVWFLCKLKLARKWKWFEIKQNSGQFWKIMDKHGMF
jgi:hypothetical protein